MSGRRLRLLIAVLAMLVAVAWATGAFEGDPSTVDVPGLDIPADRLDRIVLSGAMDLVLVRGDSAWRVVEPRPAPADSAVVARLVTSLGDLEIASLATTRPDRHGRLGIDTTATRIEASWGGDSRLLTVSRRGPDWRSHYVVLGDGPEVYATASRISLPLSVDAVMVESEEEPAEAGDSSSVDSP